MGPNLTQEVNVRVPWLSLLSEFYFLFLGYWAFLPHYHPSIPSAFCLLFFLLAWTCPPGLHFLSFPYAGLNLPEYPVGGGGASLSLKGCSRSPSEVVSPSGPLVLVSDLRAFILSCYDEVSSGCAASAVLPGVQPAALTVTRGLSY